MPSRLLHRLYAKTLIKDLQQQSHTPQGEVVALATKYSIASQFTSFVCVDKSNKSVSGSMTQKVVPIASASRVKNIILCCTGAISWRQDSIKYRKNELLFDFVESHFSDTCITGASSNMVTFTFLLSSNNNRLKVK